MISLQHLGLWARFFTLRPWTTRFRIGPRTYGGWYDAAQDERLQWFARAFPGVRTVLELGALEGGHTLGLSRLPGVDRVVAIESRTDNLRRARFVQQKLGYRAEFVQADLETFDLKSLGRFDAVYCCGLLYHLPRPRDLLDRLAAISNRLFLSTHFTNNPVPDARVHGVEGIWMKEFGLKDPLSGMSRQSFWPTRSGLTQMLRDSGFEERTVFKVDESHINGPLITLAAERG